MSISYDRRKFLQQRIGAGTGLAQQIGLANVSAAAFPTLAIGGYASLGAPGNTNTAARAANPDHRYAGAGLGQQVRGQARNQAGLEYRRGANRETDDITSSGALTFMRGRSTDQPGVNGTGDGFATFLTGLANIASLQRLDNIPSQAAYWAAYAQDDYRVTDRLTLNSACASGRPRLPRSVEGDRMNSFDRAAINPVSGTPGV